MLTVDVHHHILPDFFWRKTNEQHRGAGASASGAIRRLRLLAVACVADTSRAIAHLHYSNTFARTPNVKYIFSHAGGTIPYLASRFAVVDEMNRLPVSAAGSRDWQS